MSDRALEAVERALEVGGDADDVLRAVVAELEREPDVQWAAILFLEEGQLQLGPECGTPNEERRIHVPVSYRGTVVGELAIDGDADPAVLDRVANAISAHVLLGWDTGGETWEP